MIPAKIYGGVSTVLSAATLSASALPATAPSATNLTNIPYVGPVPLFAVCVGVLTALLVRVVVMTSNPGKLWTYNLAVTALAMLGTATFIVDHRPGVGMSFWIGASFGAVGVGIIQIAKSRIMGTLIDAVKSGLIKGLKDEPPAP